FLLLFDLHILFFFFFQAEDGIRDLYVTGVQTCALPICVNKGDEIYPLPDIPKLHVLVVSPKKIHVSTPDAYRWVKARPVGLTKFAGTSKLFEFCALCWSGPGSGLSNDFEGAVFRRHPRLDQIKRELLQKGAEG